jgi:pyridoxal phosphate enzyme (YggS family)
MSTVKSIADNLKSVRDRIKNAENCSVRAEHSVKLLVVSKTQPAVLLREAYNSGQRDFGESYVQEALQKINALSDLSDICWHFIGPLQANKTRAVATHFHWVHSVERLRIAERLSAQRPSDMPPLNVCIQINISREASKSGILPDELPELLTHAAKLPGLRLRGLMCIPDPTLEEDGLRQNFASMQALFLSARSGLPTMDTLSMGMSDDLELAIAEGATMVRVGAAVFGNRS